MEPSPNTTNSKLWLSPLEGGTILNKLNCTGPFEETVSEAATLFFPWYKPANQLAKTHLNIDIFKLGAFLLFLLVSTAVGRAIIYFWTSISSYVVEWATSKITLPDNDRVYKEVLQMISWQSTRKNSWFSDGARSLNLVSAKPWDEEDPSSIISDMDSNSTSSMLFVTLAGACLC